MTNIRLTRRNGFIVGAEAKGHSNFKEEGFDIVCAAVSTTLQGALMGLINVAKVKLKSKIKDGYLFFEIEENALNEKATAILDTMYLTLKDIGNQYKSYIKLEEHENEN